MTITECTFDVSGDWDITDLFSGAGGSSLGAARAGATIVLAANHWQRALDVHQIHFPDARHDCADISQVDPRRRGRGDARSWAACWG